MSPSRARLLARTPRPPAKPVNRFDKVLRRYDPNLFLHFNEIRGQWQVWRKSPRNPWVEPSKFVMAIATKFGKFKTPDESDLDIIIRYDMTLDGLAKRAYIQDRKRLAEKQAKDQAKAQDEAADAWQRAQVAERRYACMDMAKTLLRNRVTMPMGRLAPRRIPFGRVPV